MYFKYDKKKLNIFLSIQNASTIVAPHCPEPPDAGGTEERRNLQRTFGLVRQLDEHQLARSHLHIQRRRPVLENARGLYPRLDHQVPSNSR